MTTTLYVLLHLTMDVEEYLGLFVDIDAAKARAAEFAGDWQSVELGSWEPYGEDAFHAETLEEWNPANYVIQPVSIMFTPSEDAARGSVMVVR